VREEAKERAREDVDEGCGVGGSNVDGEEVA